LACHEPLTEAVKLWDFFSAFGFHMNVICIAAHVLNSKSEIMNLDRDKRIKYLMELPPLDAQAIINTSVQICSIITEDLYLDIVRHLLNAKVAMELASK